MATEAQAISFPIRQPHEIGLGIGDHTFPDSVFRYFHRRASDCARIRCLGSYGDSCRLQRSPFPGLPIKRVAPIIAGSQVDKDYGMTRSDLFPDYISHEELPIVLVSNDEDIVLGR